ncbi:MAG: hypothetical protein K2F62_05025 [Muribaculaceae bacterium]|nr:hypothetical protein [Muribaculaceae bacterium]
MKRYILSVILMVAVAVGGMHGQSVTDETLTYGVMFKWGIIEKEAGLIQLRTEVNRDCLIYPSPSPRDRQNSSMTSSA